MSARFDTPEEAMAEAARRVEFCLRKGRGHLNLAGLGLKELPPDFVRLDGLRYLDLTDNQLTALPEALCDFAELRWLGLNGNRIERLPARFSQLRALERLYLRGNRLQSLPGDFGELANLVELDLCDNRIANLPKSFAKLLDRPKDTATLYYNLDRNPGQVTIVARQGAEALRTYLDQLKEAPPDVFRGKLLLVGEGDVGKSTLLAALRGDAFLENRSTTHGLKMEPLTLQADTGKDEGIPLPPADTGEDIHLRCWDFSGQVELRETHQIFFTAPAIYLLIWNPRCGEHQARLLDWLWLIKHRTEGKAKVLIVATQTADLSAELGQTEEIKRSFGGPDGILMPPFFHKVECNEKHPRGQIGLEELKSILRREITANPAFRQEIPQEWDKAQQELDNDREKKPFMDWGEFERFCQDPARSIPDTRVFARAETRMGRLVWIERDQLARIVILNPDWLSKAIGFVLHNSHESTGEQPARGILSKEEMFRIWADPKALDERSRPEQGYPSEVFGTFLALMEAFDLSNPIRGPKVAAWHIIPNRLSPERPPAWDEGWNPDAACLRRRVDLRGCDNLPLNDWLASSFFYRLMVRLHPDAQGRDDYTRAAHWRYGFRLDHAYFGSGRLYRKDASIYFESVGVNPAALWWRVDLAIRQLAQDLSDDFSYSIDLGVLVPCGAGCTRSTADRWYFDEKKIAKLVNSSDSGVSTRIACGRNDCDRDFNVRELWEGLRPRPAVSLESLDAKLDDLGAGIGKLRDDAHAIRERTTSLLEGYATLADSLKQRFDALERQADSRKLTDAIRGELESIQSTIKDGFQRLLSTLDEPSRRGPCLFLIRPDATPLPDPRALLKKRFRLYLLCERNLSPVAMMKGTVGKGMFKCSIDREWWRLASPYLRGVMRLLAVFGLASRLVDDHSGIEDIAAASALAGQTAKLLEQTLNSGDMRAALTSEPSRDATGWTLNWLHSLLTKLTGQEDLTKADLGLVRVLDKVPGRYRWVHPTQADYYTSDR